MLCWQRCSSTSFGRVGEVDFELVEVVDGAGYETGDGADVGVGVGVGLVVTPPLFETIEDGVGECTTDVGVARH